MASLSVSSVFSGVLASADLMALCHFFALSSAPNCRAKRDRGLVYIRGGTDHELMFTMSVWLVIKKPAGYSPACWREESGLRRRRIGSFKELPELKDGDIKMRWNIGGVHMRYTN